jgi:hypothetical protein
MRRQTSNERLHLGLTLLIRLKNIICKRKQWAGVKWAGSGFFSARELCFDPVLRLALCSLE